MVGNVDGKLHCRPPILLLRGKLYQSVTEAGLEQAELALKSFMSMSHRKIRESRCISSSGPHRRTTHQNEIYNLQSLMQEYLT